MDYLLWVRFRLFLFVWLDFPISSSFCNSFGSFHSFSGQHVHSPSTNPFIAATPLLPSARADAKSSCPDTANVRAVCTEHVPIKYYSYMRKSTVWYWEMVMCSCSDQSSLFSWKKKTLLQKGNVSCEQLLLPHINFLYSFKYENTFISYIYVGGCRIEL